MNPRISGLVRKTVKIMLTLSLLGVTASAQTYISNMCYLADVLGVLIISLMGGRWIVADSAQERAEAKKGIIYVIVGLLVVHSMVVLLRRLYCQPAGILASCPTSIPYC